MKKLPFLFLIVLFAMCKSVPSGSSSSNSENSSNSTSKDLSIEERLEEIKEENRLPEAKDVVDLPAYAQVRDDFRSVSDKTKESYLQGMQATGDKYSVVILTQGFKGENIVVKNSSKTFFRGMTMSDLSNGIAKSVRVDNTDDFTIVDTYTNSEVTIESDHAKMFKFIYVMKNSSKDNPFKVTFSNTLRPVR
ncbi:hypothetical protein HX004_02500 [Myroides sp. 1354]|uniref:hypothetical protein n=1 Tax=unclassified Myroides TaxID=2642485 RepID=UPI002574A894|nr:MULTISPECIES: hypothetical protein [unclassified Myroides]MDM1043291.1 hypothetical protein [Myroides sp. R163-1]MDM1054656.1 hypothetical protein [Myroides sp. 1354]MDM1067953.1 hypothetical protein [Myroides sp. 1372]